METTKKTARFFSKPLMRQNIKSNWALCLAILLIMVLLGNVMNYAMSMMATEKPMLMSQNTRKAFILTSERLQRMIR